ncbi:MAG: zf-HC2 domain-containing protein [Deltaproteobacteria bacterium]|nr:zf-HC2 domain-containing protein [Deltaproteobacteria bacterium]
MDCQEVCRFLQVYLDGEFDEDDRRDVEAHLATCAACRARAEYERRFREAIRARIPKPAAPEAFRARLVQAMRGHRDRSSFPRRLVWSSVPAAAVLALVVTFTWTVTSGFSPMVDEAISRHSTETPVEVNTASSDEVEGWFRAKVDFNVALPRFSSRRLSLVGARLSHMAERQAALVRYRQGLRRYSLLVTADRGEAMEGQRCQRVEQHELCLTERRGYSVVFWRSRGLVYSMVGDTGASDLLEVLHSALARGEPLAP